MPVSQLARVEFSVGGSTRLQKNKVTEKTKVFP